MENRMRCFMNHKQSRLVNSLIRISRDCIGYARYFRLMKTEENHWSILTRNAYYDEAVINWCKLFGAYGEPTHYYEIVGQKYELSHNLSKMGLEPIDTDSLKRWVLERAGVDHEAFDVFHAKTTEYRNRNLIHFEHDPEEDKDRDLKYPEIDIILNSLCSLMEFLNELCGTFPKNSDEKNEFLVGYTVFSDRQELINYLEESFPRDLKK